MKYLFHHIPIIFCINRETAVIPAQHIPPKTIGFPPLFISLITLLFKPMAAMDITIQNFDNSFKGLNVSAGTPALTATVVTTAAATKKIMNTGKAFQKLNFFALLSFFVSFFACIRLKTRVIGIIANVLVNFTVTALSSV